MNTYQKAKLGDRLTARERQICQLLLTMTPDEVADHLGTSPQTVRNQMKHVYRKIGVKSEAGLLRRAWRRMILGDLPPVDVTAPAAEGCVIR